MKFLTSLWSLTVIAFAIAMAALHDLLSLSLASLKPATR